MKYILTLLTALCFSFSAFASVDLGVKGGWVHSYSDNTSVASTDKKDTTGLGIYSEWNIVDWFALGGAYNVFTNQSFDTPLGNHTIDIHGPEVYGKLTYHFNQSDLALFAKGGAMYTFANGEGDLSDDNRFVPVLGIGAQWQVFPAFGVRVGYDYYFDAYEGGQKAGDIELDYSQMYVGANLTF